jgi:hypothetical protein
MGVEMVNGIGANMVQVKRKVQANAASLWFSLKDRLEMRDRLPLTGQMQLVPAVVRRSMGNGLVKLTYQR